MLWHIQIIDRDHVRNREWSPSQKHRTYFLVKRKKNTCLNDLLKAEFSQWWEKNIKEFIFLHEKVFFDVSMIKQVAHFEHNDYWFMGNLSPFIHLPGNYCKRVPTPVCLLVHSIKKKLSIILILHILGKTSPVWGLFSIPLGSPLSSVPSPMRMPY